MAATLNLSDSKVKLNEKIHFTPSDSRVFKVGDLMPNESLVPGEFCRKHYEAGRGVPDEFRPSCRIVPHRLRSEEQQLPRLKYLGNREFTSTHIVGQARHFPQHNALSKEPESVQYRNSMHMTMHESGQPASRIRSEEYSLNDTMSSKKRLKDILDKRNQIPVAVPGDKSYKDPSRSIGYYKHGGMIPGSTFMIQSKVKPAAATPTEVVKHCTASLSAAEKRRLKQEESDRQQVFALNHEIEKRGQTLPSWEEKTGMWLCRPEEENDD